MSLNSAPGPKVPSDMLKWLRELIAIPSPSGGETAVADYLLAWASARGLHTVRDGDNVYVHIPGRDARRALILHAHTDVVAPGDLAAWTHPPYTPVEQDGRLYGSGASDDKAGIAVGMGVAESLLSAEAQPPVDLWLVWVVCEETDGSGSVAFARWFAEHQQARYTWVGAVLFESTDCDWIEYEAKGSLFAHISLRGPGGHAAFRPQQPATAVHNLGPLLRDIAALEQAWHAEGFARASATVTVVHSGDAGSPNRIDPVCEVVVDVRTQHGLHERAADDLRGLLTRLDHTLEIRGACPPGYTDPQDPFVRAFEEAIHRCEAGFVIDKRQSRASNDLFALTAIQIPGFVYGPGSKVAIHRPDEYVEVARVERAHCAMLALLGRLETGLKA